MPPRIALITVGQTPRTDLVPDIVARLPTRVETHELGALDGLTREEIAGLAPGPGDDRLVTRLTDGTQAVIRKDWTHGRLRELLHGMDGDAFLAIVLLCTGEFPGLRGPGFFIDAQHLVDHGTAALCHGARRIGLLLPLPEQAEEFHYAPPPRQELVTSHASPYEGDRFREAGRELAGCDLLVMHCIGYTEEQREAVARASGRPVLLARRLVASALAQLL